ncbi:hypothetical protein UC35_16035 [Ramlibacter tataouinensis]|uniref:Uncharacterized protein n=1 Tax=Ramlibacter tataouinensis TaxID=94132 RepID=A0A127JVP4_9BURK|nr:hypothetical protein UC35_16035 [Ramlibacter tataouinensis]
MVLVHHDSEVTLHWIFGDWMVASTDASARRAEATALRPARMDPQRRVTRLFDCWNVGEVGAVVSSVLAFPSLQVLE